MEVGASLFLGVQSPDSGIEMQIFYAGTFYLDSLLNCISNFMFGLIDQLLREYLLILFLDSPHVLYE